MPHAQPTIHSVNLSFLFAMEGSGAATKGESYFSNPYEIGTLQRLWWNAGWMDEYERMFDARCKALWSRIDSLIAVGSEASGGSVNG